MHWEGFAQEQSGSTDNQVECVCSTLLCALTSTMTNQPPGLSASCARRGSFGSGAVAGAAAAGA